MSYNSTLLWDWSDPITGDLIEEILEGITAHAVLHKRFHFHPAVYVVCSKTDALISSIGQLLSDKMESDGDPIRDVSVHNIREASINWPDPSKYVEIVEQVRRRIVIFKGEVSADVGGL